VIEEDDLAADLGLETTGGQELSVKETAGEKTAGLLAEADNRGRHGSGAGERES
jgi:hypothetical protein